MTSEKPEKSIHSLILDAGPIIRGEPSVSSILQQCEQVISTEAVVSEIRDEATRSRLQTTLLPFLILRNPKPGSVRKISDFARKTGDFSVLSKTDVQLLALAYDLECERNGGDWRLRSTPGQKRTNGPPPIDSNANTSSQQHLSPQKEKVSSDGVITPGSEESKPNDAQVENQMGVELEDLALESMKLDENTLNESSHQPLIDPSVAVQPVGGEKIESPPSASGQDLKPDAVSSSATEDISKQLDQTMITDQEDEDAMSNSDSEGWITPSNIKKHQSKDANSSDSGAPEPKVMQVATITTDFAMQNVLLQMNLNLLSPSLQRVRHVKTFILRCHACFAQVRDLSKQFCPRCGGPTLTRVTCSTNQNGEFKLHLKKNMQWNKRGDRYSIPKAVHGSANGRITGAGKDGWGNNLILAEDQKEYLQAITQEKRQKHRDLMDEDYLPSILSGDRNKSTGKPKVGAGRNVNSRKR